MDEYLNKYTKPSPKAPKSAHGEQINRAIEITGWEFKKLAGLTRHLTVQQIFQLNKDSKGAGALWKWLLDNKYMDKEKVKNNKHYIHMKEKMQKFPDMRECSKRIPYLKVIALRNIGLKDAKLVLEKQNEVKIDLTYEQLDKYSVEIGNQDRWWRLVQELEEDLQGEEYKQKQERARNKQTQLGYK